MFLEIVTTPNAGEDVENWMFAQYWEESEMGQPFWKHFDNFNKTKYATTIQLNQLF